MTDIIERFFYNYAEKVLQTFSNRNDFMLKRNIPLILPYPFDLHEIESNLESTREFIDLNNAIKGKYGAQLSRWGATKTLYNFFRRSGFYLDAYRVKIVNTNNLYNLLINNLESSYKTIVYLVPLENIYLNLYYLKRNLKFETFEIKRFSRSELDEVLCTDIFKVYYPWATISIDKLLSYDFVVIKNDHCPKKDTYTFDDILNADLTVFDFKLNKYPKKLEQALKIITLYNWEDKDTDENSLWNQDQYWPRFDIPIIISVDDNLLGYPTALPNVDKLNVMIIEDEETGKEKFERHSALYYYDVNELDLMTAKLAFIEKTYLKLLKELENSDNWIFVDRALDYFIKAFFSDDLEQILWHITTIESLLGEEKEKIVERLSNRIAAILGTNKKSRKKEFKAIYDLRSDLVHGNKIEQSLKLRNLRIARRFARTTLIWFLNLYDHIATKLDHNNSTISPSREQLLLLLDTNNIDRKVITDLSTIFSVDFPHIGKWIE